MRYAIVGVLMTLFLGIHAQDRVEYIKKYRDIAIVEMHRTGIPASIKLAQGILESNGGASMLAVRANNHFGMKCGSEWRGKTMMRKDDDRNRQGKLVKSCFRVFSSAEESYVAHSDFLSDPNKKHRYGPLFALASDDYRGWAYGLKKAGYATNPKYPQLLIRIIEDYSLDRIDKEALTMIAQADDKSYRRSGKERKQLNLPIDASYPLRYHNKVKTVTAFGGDTPITIAEETDASAKQIVKYNESIGSVYETFDRGDIVYLQPKRNKYKGDQEFHIVKEGETMLEIADRYGIKVHKLYRKNGIIDGLQPAPGQRLSLKKKNKRTVKVLSRAHEREEDPDVYIEKEYLEELVPSQSSKSKSEVGEAKDTTSHSAPRTSHSDTSHSAPRTSHFEPASYIVMKGDTLYGIARKHGITVDTLVKLNNLADSNIHPGQKLTLEE